MARILNARLYIVASFVVILLSFLAVRSLIAEKKDKGKEKQQKTIVLTSNWFDVVYSGSGNINEIGNQRIVGLSTSNPTIGTDPSGCATLNSGNFCQVLLEYDDSIDPEDFVDQTVQQVMGDATIEGEAKHP